MPLEADPFEVLESMSATVEEFVDAHADHLATKGEMPQMAELAARLCPTEAETAGAARMTVLVLWSLITAMEAFEIASPTWNTLFSTFAMVGNLAAELGPEAS